MEARVLQSLIKIVRHFSDRGMSLRHFKVMSAVILHRAENRPATVKSVGMTLRLKERDFQAELLELVEKRYLHETIPTYGDLIRTYTIGPMGGSLRSTSGWGDIFDETKAKKRKT